MPFLIPNNDNDDRQVDIYDEHQKSCACQLAGVWTKALCLRWRRRLLIAPYQKQTQAKLKANLNQTQSHTVEHPIHNRFGKASNFRFENCCSNNGSKLQNFEDNLLNRNNLVSAAERIKWPVVFFCCSSSEFDNDSTKLPYPEAFCTFESSGSEYSNTFSTQFAGQLSSYSRKEDHMNHNLYADVAARLSVSLKFRAHWDRYLSTESFFKWPFFSGGIFIIFLF